MQRRPDPLAASVGRGAEHRQVVVGVDGVRDLDPRHRAHRPQQAREQRRQQREARDGLAQVLAPLPRERPERAARVVVGRVELVLRREATEADHERALDVAVAAARAGIQPGRERVLVEGAREHARHRGEVLPARDPDLLRGHTRRHQAAGGVSAGVHREACTGSHGVSRSTSVAGSPSLSRSARCSGFRNPCVARAVEEPLERVVVAADVQEPDRLEVDAEHRPGQRLDDLLERPDATGQRDEGVGQLGHPRLALVHRLDDLQPRETLVADLARPQRARQDADDLAARVQRGVREDAHEPDARAAVHDADAASREDRDELRGGVGVRRIGTRARSGVEADAAQLGHALSLRQPSGGYRCSRRDAIRGWM